VADDNVPEGYQLQCEHIRGESPFWFPMRWTGTRWERLKGGPLDYQGTKAQARAWARVHAQEAAHADN
jgi:hypothetical protein